MTNAEAVREEWRGPVESMSQVLAQMRRVRSAVAREEGPSLDHIRPRNSVLNLVVVAREWSGAEEAAATIARLAAGHPCRAIFLVDEPESKRTHIEARVAVQARPLAAGMMCEYEQVFLRVEGPTANHIPSLVEPLLEGDLRTVLWWIGSPPIGTRRFAEAHHIRWWSEGGRTDLHNLALICSFHHKLVHEYGWRIERLRDGTTAWFHLDGVPHVAGPAPPEEVGQEDRQPNLVAVAG